MPINSFLLSVDYNVDRRKVAFESKFSDRKQYHVGTYLASSLKNKFFLNSNIAENTNLLKNKIKLLSHFNDYNNAKVSPEIIHNSLRIINSLPASVTTYLQSDSIYATKLGTIIIDWEIDTENILSLEIAKKSIGYFVEVNGTDYKEVSCISTKNISLIVSSLTNDLSIIL